MGVKTIFKVLIGTVVVIVASSFLIEMYNLSVVAFQIHQITRMAGRQSCELFAQETYKQYSGAGGAVNIKDIRDEKGNVYIEGKFYNGKNANDIYNNLYKSSTNFKKWIQYDQAVKKGNWYNLKLLALGLGLRKDGTSSEKELGMNYVNAMMTPLNLGIPYLDRDTVNRMFRWHLAEMFSSSNSSLIRKDNQGRTYVAFKGFRIYADMAAITKIEYKTFDLTNKKDREEFQNITSIDPNNLKFEVDPHFNIDEASFETDKQRVCVVGIYYAVPVSYEGVTPLKEIFNFVWNYEVSGYNDGDGRTTYQQWQDSIADLTGGGFGNDVSGDILPVPVNLIYYIIK